MVFHAPCNLGDEVWIISNDKILHGTVESFSIRTYGTYGKASLFRDENNDGFDYEYECSFDVKDFDAKVFLNKKQAERALIEQRKQNYEAIRASVDNWPQWKKDLCNDELIVSPKAKKI